MGWKRGTATSNSVIAPPRQRIVRCAARFMALDRIMTSSSKARSNSLRSRALVVGADQTLLRSLPSDRIAARSSARNARGRCCSRRVSFGAGGFHSVQTLFPLGFETARDQSVFGIDRTIAALGPLCFILCAFHFTFELREHTVMVGFHLFGSLECSLEAGWCQRGEKSLGHGIVDLPAADLQAPLTASVTNGVACAIITWRRIATAVVRPGQISTTTPTASVMIPKARIPSPCQPQGPPCQRDLSSVVSPSGPPFSVYCLDSPSRQAPNPRNLVYSFPGCVSLP